MTNGLMGNSQYLSKDTTSDNCYVLCFQRCAFKKFIGDDSITEGLKLTIQ